jgi:hypothetical protein
LRVEWLVGERNDLGVDCPIDFKAMQMPEAELKEVGEWLLKAYSTYQSAKGTYAVAPQKFYEQKLYPSSSDEVGSDVLTDNPATRARAQMEAS